MSVSVPDPDAGRRPAPELSFPDEFGAFPPDRPYVVPQAPSQRRNDHAWVWQVSALSIILGGMLALAIRTTDEIRRSGQPTAGLGVSGVALRRAEEANRKLDSDVKRLTEKVRELENGLAERSEAGQTLRRQLTDIQAVAGLIPVEGPGIRVRLRDAPEEIRNAVLTSTPEELDQLRVHDQDINGLLNELKASGAEAIAVFGADEHEGQRITATSAARCVGPTAVVNGVYLSAPYTVVAIGSPSNLRQALQMPEGYVKARSLDVLKMIEIEEAEKVVIPGYSGSFEPKHARPTPEKP